MTSDPDVSAALRAAGFTPAQIEQLARMEAAARTEFNATGRRTPGAFYATAQRDTRPTPAHDVLADGLAAWGAPPALAAEFRSAGVTDPGMVAALCRRAAGTSKRLTAAAVTALRLNLIAYGRRAAS